MMRFITSLSLIGAAAVVGAPMGFGDTLAIGSGWVEQVQEMNAGNYFSTFYTAAQAEDVEITGFYYTGDYYRVTVNGNTVLTTAQVGAPNQDIGDTETQYQEPGPSYTSGLFSTGEFYVNANDVVEIYDLYPPEGIGEVGVQAVATPEPADVGLVGAGLMALVAIARRYRRR